MAEALPALVNYTAEKALADLIYQLGEERRARKIARAIARPVQEPNRIIWPILRERAAKTSSARRSQTSRK